jgi:hypothetical protein
MVYNQVLKKALQVCPKVLVSFSAGGAGAAGFGLRWRENSRERRRGDGGGGRPAVQGVRQLREQAEGEPKENRAEGCDHHRDGKIGGREVSLAAMEFAFLGGSMGAVVGEKVTRTIERGLQKKAPVIVFSASGRRADVRGNVQPDADGQNESGRLAKLGGGRPAVCVSA